ncbi:MAG: hypothetical protein VX438_05215 [Planctomycetota bacterium]|nr:hypothetical protein [Planctomycetota bacterium]
MDFKFCLTLAALSMLNGVPCNAQAGKTGEHLDYHEVKQIDIDRLNRDLKNGMPTVDLSIYLGETTGFPHGYIAVPGELVGSIQKAKNIFIQAGVQLKVCGVKRVVMSADWLELTANTIEGVAVDPKYNAYLGYRRAKWALTKKATRVFDGMVEQEENNDRTVYLLFLKEVKMAYFDRSGNGKPKIRSIATGGLSFPSYLFEDRIPRRLRGVITLCRDRGDVGRTIAHELGHKLINVSHEYRHIDPRFEVRGEGGLMIYGSGTEIPAGKAGRWQKERLHLSPYIYRRAKDGSRRWNRDYQETGHYFDPVYGDHVTPFGEMKLPSAESSE